MTDREQEKMRLRASAVLVMILTGLPATHSSALQQSAVSQHDFRNVVDQAWQAINQAFVDPTYNHCDWLQTRRRFLSKPYATAQEAHTAIAPMLLQLGDPLTRFMNAAQLASTMQDMDGQVASIGLADPWTVRADVTGGFKILHLVALSPALKAGLQPGDILEAIDGAPTAGLSRDELFRRARGAPGTAVRLKIQRGQGSLEVGLVREPITLHTVRAFASTQQGLVIGYIGLSQFVAKSGQEVRQAITELLRQKVTAFVLDLRNNPGGFVPASREVASLFLGQETLYYSIDRTGTAKAFVGSGSPVTVAPVVVLVNGATASAAEMLAGALQDHHRAVLVGSRTFGQGRIHSVQPLTDGSAVVLAIACFRTPAGREVERKGLEPDYTLEIPEQSLQPSEIASSQDAQYQEAAAVLMKTSAGGRR